MAVDKQELRRARVAIREFTDRALSYPNVIGCGVGWRSEKGRPTGEVGIVVFVSRKLPLSALRADEVLPRSLELADGPVLIDVVERAESRLLVDSNQYRPVVGGCEISATAQGGTGTLGGVLYDRTDTEVVLLTNNHVLTSPGQRTTMPQNTTVRQPFGGGIVGNTKRIVPWFLTPLGDFGAKYQARVDAGIVALDPSVAARFSVLEIGRHPYVPLPPYEGLEVQKRGRTTDLTTGTIKEIDVTTLIRDFNGDLIRLGGVDSGFSIQAPDGALFAQGGDSGSLVIDADGGAARGLLFSSDQLPGGISQACELSAVMQELQLETPCTGSLNALFMRALRSRLLRAHLGDVDTTVSGAVSKNITKFRALYLKAASANTVADGIENMFQALAPEFSDALAFDEDFAGLLDRAVGGWLTQPTVFDMLEYQIPKEFPDRLARAFERLRELDPDACGYEWLVPAFRDTSGLSMREALAREGPREARRRPSRRAKSAARSRS